MLNRNKKFVHFLQLSFIFGSLTLFALISSWGYKSGMEANMGMMGQSMGTMMRTHAQNITFSDLIKQNEQMSVPNTPDLSRSSHHEQNNSYLKLMHYVTSATIIILLPFILAGAVFLCAVTLWRS